MLTALCPLHFEIQGTIEVAAVKNYPLIRGGSKHPWNAGDNHKSEQLVWLKKQHDKIRNSLPAAYLILDCSVFLFWGEKSLWDDAEILKLWIPQGYSLQESTAWVPTPAKIFAYNHL